MSKKLTIEQKFNLIKRNTEEIIEEKELKEILKSKQKPVVYLGTAVTGKPHIGYYLWALKVADFLKAGFKVKILLADLHGALDNTPWAVLDKRYDYYSKIIPAMIFSIGVNINELEIVKGSDFQLGHDYMFDVLKMSSIVSIHDVHKAASEVVKMGENPKLSGIIYPVMQAVDEQYLDVDVQMGGSDQRKIMVLARENLPKIGYKPRVELIFPLIPGLIGKKMSASDEKSKIDLLDDEKSVAEKVKNAECAEGDLGNGVIAFLKYILMIIKKDAHQKFIVERLEKYGGNLEYESYEEIEKDFVRKKLHPLDLKNAVSREINLLLKDLRNNKELLELKKRAYG